jgi:hypothetical protein
VELHRVGLRGAGSVRSSRRGTGVATRSRSVCGLGGNSGGSTTVDTSKLGQKHGADEVSHGTTAIATTGGNLRHDRDLDLNEGARLFQTSDVVLTEGIRLLAIGFGFGSTGRENDGRLGFTLELNRLSRCNTDCFDAGCFTRSPFPGSKSVVLGGPSE